MSQTPMLRVARNQTLITNAAYEQGAASEKLEASMLGVGAGSFSTSTGVFRFEDQRAQSASNRLLVVDATNSGTADGASLFEVQASGQARLKVRYDGNVNTDGEVHWSRPVGDDRWRDKVTFGSPEAAHEADYKSPAWWTLGATDLLVTDDYGWVSYDSALSSQTMLSKVTSYTSCQTTPSIPPGSPAVD